LSVYLHRSFGNKRDKLNGMTRSYGLGRIPGAIGDRRQSLDRLEERTYSGIVRSLKTKRNSLEAVAGKMDALSPESVLRRGYSMVKNRKGEIVSTAVQLTKGEAVDIRFAVGTAAAKIVALGNDNERKHEQYSLDL